MSLIYESDPERGCKWLREVAETKSLQFIRVLKGIWKNFFINEIYSIKRRFTWNNIEVKIKITSNPMYHYAS